MKFSGKLASGVSRLCATDHAPHTGRSPEYPNASGMPGVEHRYRLLQCRGRCTSCPEYRALDVYGGCSYWKRGIIPKRAITQSLDADLVNLNTYRPVLQQGNHVVGVRLEAGWNLTG